WLAETGFGYLDVEVAWLLAHLRIGLSFPPPIPVFPPPEQIIVPVPPRRRAKALRSFGSNFNPILRLPIHTQGFRARDLAFGCGGCISCAREMRPASPFIRGMLALQHRLDSDAFN